MKKVLSIVAIAGMAMLASCGNAEALKKIADSMKQDSTMKAEKKKSDSIRMADSTAKAMADAAAKAKAMEDSAKKADSMANAKGPKKK